MISALLMVIAHKCILKFSYDMLKDSALLNTTSTYLLPPLKRLLPIIVIVFIIVRVIINTFINSNCGFLTTKGQSNQHQKRPFVFVLISADCRFFVATKEEPNLQRSDPLCHLRLTTDRL